MLRRTAILFLRALCLVLAAFLLHRLLIQQDRGLLESFLQTATSLPGIAALALYLFVQFLGAWRWQILLRPPKLELPFLQAFRLTMGGNFFSLVIPGGVSGDIVKVGAATCAHPGKAPELALVDLLDRAIGLAGLFLAGVCPLALLLTTGELAALPKQAALAAALLLVGGLAGIAVLVLLTLWFLKHTRTIRDSEAPSAGFLRRTFQRLTQALSLYQDAPGALGKALLISFLIHGLLGLELFCLGSALSDCKTAVLPCFLVAQLANATAILPLTPGGLGVRDTVAQRFLLAFGTASGDATLIPLFHTIVLTLWGLLGAVLYLITPPPKPTTRSEETLNP